MTDLIYLDYNATTPVDRGVFDAMAPWHTNTFGNASSQHVAGRVAAEAVADARLKIAELVGCSSSEVIFTSGATEANNLALSGVVTAAASGRDRVVSCVTEHKAVLEPLARLQAHGTKVDLITVDRQGRLDLDHLRAVLGSDVCLVTVMTVNNETGVVSPVAQIAQLAHEAGALVHSDATQAVGRTVFDVDALDVDIASFSAHKMYGPKGVGALYVRRRTQLEPLMQGGSQEKGLRPGTLNVSGIVGFGEAAALAESLLAADEERILRLRQDLVTLLRKSIPNIELPIEDGPEQVPTVTGTISVRFVGADAEAVIAHCPSVAISAGSACTSGVPEPSHVLDAMLRDRAAASECVRISLGRPTTDREVVVAAEELATAVGAVRELERGSERLRGEGTNSAG